MLSPVDQIKDRLSISDVVSSYLKLEKTGQNFKARCPFHNEKNSSFTVYLKQNKFYCFGCRAGTDSIDYVMKRDNCTFTEAVRRLLNK